MRRYRQTIKAFSLGLALCGVAIGGWFLGPIGLVTNDREPWNVLLITLDTTRADHLGCYGHENAATPHLDALAAEGTRFESAFSSVPLTAPSHSTIMTGRYPFAHGVRDNGMFVLSESQTTLAEVLSREGYATGAAVAAFPLQSQFGLDQGFEFFDDDLTGGNGPIPAVGHRKGIYMDERPAGMVNLALIPWLTETRDRPFFAWVHYFDAHQPANPPPPYDQLFAHAGYDGEIAYVDETVGRLLDELRELGLYDSTLIVVTADHGDGLGDHREMTHAFQLYNSTLRVPFLVRVPSAPKNVVSQRRVGTVDILPTVLDLLSIPVPEGVQGISLKGSIIGQDQSAGRDGRSLYAETLSPRLSQGWGELRAIYKDRYKYIFGPRPELYDLEEDPDELNDLVTELPSVATSLKGQLADWLGGSSVVDARVEIDTETRHRLMSLGYLHSASVDREKMTEVLRSDGVAPQDRVEDVNALTLAKLHLSLNRPLMAREKIKLVLRRQPDSPGYLELLADAEMLLGNFEAAEEALTRLESKHPGLISPGSTTYLQLADLALVRGDLPSALIYARRHVDRAPTAAGLTLLGEVLWRSGVVTEAINTLEDAVDLDPEALDTRLNLAIDQAGAGLRSEATASLRVALNLNPFTPLSSLQPGCLLLRG